MTGQTQPDELKLSISKKPQLLSTHITTTPVEEDELLGMEAHIHSYTCTCTHVYYTHTKLPHMPLANLLLCMYGT